MELFDSHAHYNDIAYQEDLENVLKKGREVGIKYIANIGYDEVTSRLAVSMAEEFPNMYAVVGNIPSESNHEVDLHFVEELAVREKVVAIGEIGLDYHYEDTNPEMQKKYFIEQIQLANHLHLPVCIHSRDADRDMLEILKKYPIEKKAVMHCFSSSLEVAKEIIKLGYFISIAGTVTFKNARKVQEVARFVPQEQLLIETDCPYLTPEPNRGKRNDSSYMVDTAQKIADLREISVETLAEITTQNAKRFYQIED